MIRVCSACERSYCPGAKDERCQYRVDLESTTTTRARKEAKQYAPCRLYGLRNGMTVYISAVNPGHPVATARRGSLRPNQFYVIKKPGHDYSKTQRVLSAPQGKALY